MSDLSYNNPNEFPDLRQLIEQMRPVLDSAIDLFALARADRRDLPRIYEALVEKHLRGR